MVHILRILVLLATFYSQMVIAEDPKNKIEEAADVSMSATLLGCISFIMILYYFTNYHDEDIQQSTWDIISSTISIFCAVLLFQSFNSAIEMYIINPFFGEKEASMGALVADMVHMLCWFLTMQYALAKFSGALDEAKLEIQFPDPEKSDSKNTKRSKKEKLIKEKNRRSLNLECFAVLLAHLTGFASINSWGTVQQFDFFKRSPFHALGAVPIAIIGQICLQRATDYYREHKALKDGSVSWYEKKWDSQTEEAENDVMALTVSFLTMNAIRMSITGCLPNQEGAEEECEVEEYLWKHNTSQKLMLTSVIVITTIVIFVTLYYVNFPEEEEEEEDSEDEDEDEPKSAIASVGEVKDRLMVCMLVALSMLFSWSFFFTAQMWLAGIEAVEGMEELLAVIIAFIVSIISFALLVVLDKIKDADSGKVVEYMHPKLEKETKKKKAKEFDGKIDKGLKQIMFAIGLAVGFSWEQCFDKSVDSLAEKTEESKLAIVNPNTTKIFLSVFCSALLVPAWRLYVLPFVQSKGWKYGWTVNLVEKYKLDKEHPDPNKAICVEVKERMQHHVKAIKRLVNSALDDETIANEREEGETKAQTQKRLLDKLEAGVGFASTTPHGLGSEMSYRSLPGNEADALHTEVKELKSQVLAYRRMFDEHMTNMGTNLRKMSDTMDRPCDM